MGFRFDGEETNITDRYGNLQFFGTSSSNGQPTVGLRAGGNTVFRTTASGIIVNHATNTNDGNIYFGTNANAYIHNDNDSEIFMVSGSSDRVITGNNNDTTYLYYNGTWAGRTRSDGFQIQSTSNTADATLTLGGGSNRIVNDNDSYTQWISGSGDTVIFHYNNASDYLYHDGTQVIQTHAEGIYVKSINTNTDGTVYLGNQGYARITGDHDNATYIYSGSGDAVVWGSNNSRTYLYYNGTSTLYTDANGIFVRSVSDAGYGVVYVGNSGYGGLYGNSGNTWLNTAANDNIIWGMNNSYTYLYYDNSWKARTRSDGFEVNGSLIVSDKISVSNSYGTSGQVLTSNGGSSAASWQDAGGGGAWELQSSTNLTGTGSSSYFRHFTLSNGVWHRFIFSNFWWSVSGDYLGALFSRDGGSNYDSLNWMYWYGSGWTQSPYSYYNAGSNTYPRLIHEQTNAFQKSNIVIYVFAPAQTTFQGYTSNGMATLWGEIVHLISGRTRRQVFKASNSSSSSVVNYIRFEPYNYQITAQGMNGVLKHETLTAT